MNEERKAEELKTDIRDWNIWFDLEDHTASNHFDKRSEMGVLVKFSINRKEYRLTEMDIGNLKQDLKDLGKFRIIKQGKEFLEK